MMDAPAAKPYANSSHASISSPQLCIPPWQFAELTDRVAGSQTDAYGKTSVALGSYERISPDGRFVLRSFSGSKLGEVSLIELDGQGRVVRAMETPLSNEAFPVQGSWRYLVDVNGDHYTFKSLLGNIHKGSQTIKPLFRGGMTGFYAAASELPAAKSGYVRIRSLSWPNANADGERQGEGALVSRTIEVDTVRQVITADSGLTSLCTERLRQDGPLYALPMISVDGQEFAALPQTPVQGQSVMRIFGFGESGKACTPRAAFNFSSGKTIFGFSTPGRGADLAYEYQAQVWWYQRGVSQTVQPQANQASKRVAEPSNGHNTEHGIDRDKEHIGHAFNLAPYFDNPSTLLLASAFPGITRDGRVIYAATYKDCGEDKTGQQCRQRSGYVITDPYQSNAYQQFLREQGAAAAHLRTQCITHADVARERAAFAQFHQLTP